MLEFYSVKTTSCSGIGELTSLIVQTFHINVSVWQDLYSRFVLLPKSDKDQSENSMCLAYLNLTDSGRYKCYFVDVTRSFHFSHGGCGKLVELNRKFHISEYGRILYIYIFKMCRMFIIRRVHRRFYGLYFIKKANSHLGKVTMDMLDSSMIKKMAADSKSKGKEPGYTCKQTIT